ncbi:uncharacterized protein LOC131617251 [Vicia villosa]|uniref:uncharacterized protein LOC131617251 n=1 Tax=Vicia villosa TaxID=3911 RepID=UPI00273B0780|nr:uncharacterized protein LOC131617251 [Vicia villosa]
MEGDTYVVQGKDHEELKQAKNQNISHGSPKYENEQDGISSDTSSSQDVENQEGDSFVVQNEDHEESRQVKSQNISLNDAKYENKQDDISSHTSDSQDVESLEVDNVVHNEDHEESKEVISQNISLNDPKYENEQDDKSSHTSDSQDVENLEVDNVVQNEDHEESKEVISQNISHDGPKYENEQDDTSSDTSSSKDVEHLKGDAYIVNNEDHKESKQAKSQNCSHDGPKNENEQDISSDTSSSQDVENLGSSNTPCSQNQEESKQVGSQNMSNDSPNSDVSSNTPCSQNAENLKRDTYVVLNEDHEELKQVNSQNISHDGPKLKNEQDGVLSDTSCSQDVEKLQGDAFTFQKEDSNKDLKEENFENMGYDVPGFEEKLDDILDNIYGMTDVDCNTPKRVKDNVIGGSNLSHRVDGSRTMDSHSPKINQKIGNTSTEVNTMNHKVDTDPGAPHVVEKAVSLKNFVREKSLVAVSTLLRRLSRKTDDGYVCNSDNKDKDVSDISRDSESKEAREKTTEKMNWRDEPITEGPLHPIAMKGRIIVYTRLACRECKEVRRILYVKRLRYVEINIDVYPSRKMELEKISGSTSVPKVFFNEVCIGSLSELKTLNESGKLDGKIDFLIAESPLLEGPLPPLSGEDDVSSSGAVDEMALIVRKMKESIVVRDRFSKLRRFTNCFIGSEAVDFLSEDQILERKEAIEFGRKLASKLFFQHVLDDNLFEDGNYLYRFLDDDPIVASQCHNIPRGITTTKPKPITEIASRLRLLSYAMFEAYASEDGRHIDYRSMHGSEEFARYLRIVEELQRVEVSDLSREETIAFFLNLYNMMTIHAILVWGHPDGILERRRLFGDFKYVIGGSTYSLSAIQNGILRGNQRQPYTLMRPFGAKDKRLMVALSLPEPLIHFALVCGTRSGPALRCYSPGDIDSELMDAAHNFLRNGGVMIDFTAKVAYTSKILKWFSLDFGKNEVEVMKHVSIYLDPSESELLFDLLATSELKVIYQPYDWGLNC